MSFSSRCYRFIWNRVSRIKINHKCWHNSNYAIQSAPKSGFTLPCALSFSLYTLLGSEKKISEEDELILTIKHCILFIQRDEFDKGEQLLHVALRKAQQIQNQLAITYIYDVMANLALKREHLDKAKKLFIAVSQRLLADGVKEDDLKIIHMSVKLARISHLQEQFSLAQVGYDWSLNKLHNKLTQDPDNENIKTLIAMTEDWYGRLLVENNQCENGLKYMENALNHMKLESSIEKEHVVQQLSDIGAFYCDYLGKVDISIKYFKEAIEIGKNLKGYDELGAVYINLGRAYLKKTLLIDARRSCGYAWKLGYASKNEEVIKEAELCLNEIKNATK